MILLLLNPLVDLNEHLFILDVGSSDQWLAEPCDWSRLLVNLKEISNIKKVELLTLHIDESHVEMSIVLVRNEKFLTSSFLFDKVNFQVHTRNDHSECALLLSEAVSLHLKVLIILLRDCDTGL